MQDPSYGTISDVAPDLSGDPPYTTLQGWYEDTYGETSIQHARCHHGNSTGLGELDTSTQTWAFTPTANEPVCIYAADGDEADGSADDDNQGAAIVTATAAPCLLLDWHFVDVAGLRLTVKSSTSMGAVHQPSGDVSKPPCGATVERCTIVQNRPSGAATAGVAIGAVGTTYSGLVRNNLILNADSTKDCAGIVAQGSNNASFALSVEANSVANCAATGLGGIVGFPVESDQVLDITTRNNVVVNDGNQGGDCFAEQGNGTTNWDSDYDVSSDATASGANSKTSVAIASVWADITDNDAPFMPKAPGELDPPDGVNLYAAGVTTDALGAERPSEGAHYRGGQGIFAGLYKAYGGATPALVDYGVTLASVRAGSTSIDVAGLGLASGGTHYLGARATSVAGIEETNTDRLTRAVVNQSGQLQPLPLAAVEELTAELLTDGTVIVGFSHAASPGWAGPTRFEVLSDNGTGELNLTTPAATIDVTDPGAGDYEARLDPATLPAMFSARACSGADDGPVAPPVTVSPPAGPTAPQQI